MGISSAEALSRIHRPNVHIPNPLASLGTGIETLARKLEPPPLTAEERAEEEIHKAWDESAHDPLVQQAVDVLKGHAPGTHTTLPHGTVYAMRMVEFRDEQYELQTRVELGPENEKPFAEDHPARHSETPASEHPAPLPKPWLPVQYGYVGTPFD